VPGIGKRTAERIVVELKAKIPADDPIVITRTASADPRVIAREGLVGLGFSLAEAELLLQDAPGSTPEALITHALKVSRR
jgi:Holliday junction DNA helicase RuvA